MNIGDALKLVKGNNKVKRSRWGKDEHVYITEMYGFPVILKTKGIEIFPYTASYKDMLAEDWELL